MSIYTLKIIGYDYFIMPQTGIHSIIPKDTLIITKKQEFSNIKEGSIIFTNNSDIQSNLAINDVDVSIVYVLKNDFENQQIIVSSDDLKLNTTNIDYDNYINSIFVYIHDIDFFLNILQPFKLQLLLFPIICYFMIILCDAFIIKHKNDEDFNFECDEIITKIINDNNEHYQNVSNLNYTLE